MLNKIKKFLARLYDLKNAYRVLDIMDRAGCDIYKADNCDGYWKIVPKWYVSEQEAKDIQNIVLFKKQYKERSKVWEKIFHEYRSGCRVLDSWF